MTTPATPPTPMRPSTASAKMTTATLLACCDDRPGLVAALSQLLYALGLNILDADQHTDSKAKKFFNAFDSTSGLGMGRARSIMRPSRGPFAKSPIASR